MRQKALFSLFIGVFLILFSCATGEKSVISNIPVVIPSSTEVQWGGQVAQQTLQDFPLCTNRKIVAFVTNLGQKLVRVCDRQDIPYSFFVLKTNMVNAFAAPGGYIFVTTGLMKSMDNEAQLAGVIGHELGHVTARHAMKALELQVGMQVLGNILLGTNQTLSKQLVQTGAGLLMLRHSRDQEYEADQLGTKYSFKAGYDPYEMATFLGKLAEMEKGGKQVEFLSTHPLSEKRMVEVNEFCIAITSTNKVKLDKGTERYLKLKKDIP